MATKQEEKFFFFWGHTEKSGRAAVFSNWYPSKFVEEENGISFFSFLFFSFFIYFST